MSTMENLEKFVRLANFFGNHIGMKPWGRLDGFQRRFLFYFSSINLLITFIAESSYIIVTITSDFILAVMTLSYVTFIVVAYAKWYYLYTYQTERTAFFQRLETLFPCTKSQQEAIKLSEYIRMNKLSTISYTISFLMCISTYTFYTIARQFIYTNLLHVPGTERNLPYQAVYPWDWRDNWTYYVCYVSQGFAGWHSTCAQMAFDLMLCTLSTHLIMHYDHISRSLEGYQTKFAEIHGKNGLTQQARAAMELKAVKDDIKFISSIVAYHTELLSLSDLLNKLYGLPLFVNFFTSSAIICFVSFQMSITREFDLLVKLGLFLFFSLLQVYLICYFGQLLIDASTNVANAAYFQDWSHADIRFQKMTILVAERAQDPAALKATKLITISRDTMTVIMQMSYKFFTVLRTMYGD